MPKKVATKGRPTLTGQIRNVIRSRGLTFSELAKLSGVNSTVRVGRPLGKRDVRGETLDKIVPQHSISASSRTRRPSPRAASGEAD